MSFPTLGAFSAICSSTPVLSALGSLLVAAPGFSTPTDGLVSSSIASWEGGEEEGALRGAGLEGGGGGEAEAGWAGDQKRWNGN